MESLAQNLPYLLIAVSALLLVLGVALGIKTRAAAQAEAALAEQKAELERLATERDEAREKLYRAETRLEELDTLRQRRDELQDRLSALQGERQAAEATLREREQALAREKDQLVRMGAEIQEKFKSLASEALKASQTQFLDLANATFDKHKSAASADMEKRQEGIANLLKPMQDTLKRYEDGLKDMEQKRQHAYGSLQSELKTVIETQNAVRSETSKLVTALRAQPKTRGRWGEQQLQNVMELSGMTEHVDFDREVHVAGSGDSGPLRPDAIIRMPGNRQIVVDAKTSLSAYLDALEAADEVDRDRLMGDHARQIRSHVKALAAKEYWSQFEDAPDFVAMFVPGENFFSAAIERDPDLLEFAMRQHVLIVTPTTLMALAKAVAYGWRQEKVAENAREVADLGRELYDRLATMGGHLARMGKSLGSSVDSYNKLVGSMERNVLPQARKFKDLKVIEGAKATITDVPLIETEPREPLAGKDLILEGPGVDETDTRRLGDDADAAE